MNKKNLATELHKIIMDGIISTKKDLPCIGCGYCCTKAKCIYALEKYGYDDELCEALYWSDKDKRHYCRLIDNNYENIRNGVYVGEGCTSTLFNTYRDELKPRVKARGNKDD